MNTLSWIIISGLLMSCIALVGSLSLLMTSATLEKILVPLVAFAAGALLAGAFFHMIPVALLAGINITSIGVLVLIGFTTFLILEQYLHWHHDHTVPKKRKAPLTYLVLIGDGLHNFLGGLAIGGTFLIDIRLGIASWLAAAAHEVPQELGDFAVLIHGGWSKRSALLFNFLSGLTFLLGGLVAYKLSFKVDVSWLIAFAAGNFIYIGASDLVPQVNQQNEASSYNRVIAIIAFVFGVLFLFLPKLL
jgi:zinc and cadmium transporter